MLTLAILGFLADEPLHGYELKARLSDLTGHVKPVSDGALYPAINRLEAAGHLTRRDEPGTGAAPRRMLHLTEQGREHLLDRLRAPSDTEISDRNRYFTLLAFLHHLPAANDRDQVLHRRLAFLDAPASFFTTDGKPVRAAEATDPYRRGMLVIARATRQAERAWLQDMLNPHPTQ